LQVIDTVGSTLISTDESGRFSIALPQLKPPVLLKVSLSDGRHLLSIWDGSGNSTANITPLSDAVVSTYAQLIGTTVQALTPAMLNQPQLLAQAKDMVKQWVAEGLLTAGINPSTMDLLSTPFDSNGVGVGLVTVLDAISFERSATGEIVLYPKQLLLPGEQAPEVAQPLGANATLKSVINSSDLLTSTMLSLWRTRINACMLLPVSVRAASSSCSGIAPTKYKNHGTTFQTNFFAETTEESTVGAKFEVPTVLSMGNDEQGSKANVEIRWFQPRTGSTHSLITVFRDLGSAGALQDNQVASATGSSWWLWGNQTDLEVRIEPKITYYQNLNPLTQLQSPSYVGYGLHILINSDMAKDGKWVDAGIVYAKVTGAGLPEAGVVLAPVDKSRFDSPYLAILNADGVFPSSPTLPQNDVSEFRLAAQPLGNIDANSFAQWWSQISSQYPDHRLTMLSDFSNILAQAPYKVQILYRNGTVSNLLVRLTGTLRKISEKQIEWPEFLNINNISANLQNSAEVINFGWSSSQSTLKPESSFLYASAAPLPGCTQNQRWSLLSVVNNNKPTSSFSAASQGNCRSSRFPGNEPDSLSLIGLKAMQEGVRYHSMIGWQSAPAQ
jgi:hypothetical protein